MTFTDAPILETDAPGVHANDYEVVSLVGHDSAAGLQVFNAFGVAADMARICERLGRPVKRLQVAVADPRDEAAVQRVRDLLRWRDGPPF